MKKKLPLILKLPPHHPHIHKNIYTISLQIYENTSKHTMKTRQNKAKDHLFQDAKEREIGNTRQPDVNVIGTIGASSRGLNIFWGGVGVECGWKKKRVVVGADAENLRQEKNEVTDIRSPGLYCLYTVSRLSCSQERAHLSFLNSIRDTISLQDLMSHFTWRKKMEWRQRPVGNHNHCPNKLSVFYCSVPFFVIV